MSANPKIVFIGAGSTVFMKNIVGDVLQRAALAGAELRLMDINEERLAESAIVWRRPYLLGTSKSIIVHGS